MTMMIDLGIVISFLIILQSEKKKPINDLDKGIKAIFSRHANMCINFLNELI